MIKKDLKMNHNGLTAIEVLVCFSIVVVIVMSMFKVVNNQRDKQMIESYKNSVVTYKNTVTKAIEEDIRKNGGIVSVLKILDDTDNMGTETIDSSGESKVEVTFILKKDSNNLRKLIIHKKYNCDEDAEEESTSDKINSCEEGNYIEYFYTDTKKDVFKIPNIYNLRFNRIDATENNSYLKIYVEFIHPDLGTKYYALDIIHPVNSNIFQSIN